MLTSDELRHADKSQRWHHDHSGDERVADAARLSSPIPRKSHLRRAGWDYGEADGRDRAARRQSGTLLRVTVGVVGQAGLSPDSPSVRGLGFPARHRAATSAPSCRSCPNRALFESCTSPRFARSADHIRSHSCIPPLYKHLYKHHRRLTRRMFRGHPRTVTQNPRSVTTDRNIEHRPTVWRGTIFGSRRARHHPQLTGRAARSRLSPHARRLTDASRCPSAKTRYRYSVNFREAAAPVVVKPEPLDCSEATAVTLCEPGASAFGRRTVQAPAFPTIAT